ncbi:MAG: hypothetical protein LQ340_005796 [Diploschistes diacapsis]|nr:MAG: hypothetical protein LQ340_005796 [Diploschistes diacapsis]
MGEATGVEHFNSLDFHRYIQSLPSTLFKFNFEPQPVLYRIDVETSDTISSDDLHACFNLVIMTSKAHYASSSTGWHPKAKMEEMKLLDLKYLLIRAESDPEVLGFASFMLTYEDGIEVVYLYEIHLSERLRGIGLGAHIVTLIQAIGFEFGMAKMMLTVFVANKGARTFYERLGFSVDECTPEPKRLRNGVVKELDYTILSIPLRAEGQKLEKVLKDSSSKN